MEEMKKRMISNEKVVCVIAVALLVHCREFFLIKAATCGHNSVAQSYLLSRPILCNSMDCSPRGSSVHGIFQARILEWVAIPFSRGSS